MDRSEREALDRHLTGNYGEDSVQDGGDPDDEGPELVFRPEGADQPPSVTADYLEDLATGYETRMEDEEADRQYLLESLIDDLRKAAAAARRERS